MEQEADDLEQPRNPAKKKGEKLRRNEWDSNDQSDRAGDDGAEKQDDWGGSFDNPPDPPQDDAGDNRAAGGW